MSDPGDREDELARTATAPGGSATSATSPIAATLGRYRLERELGAGGMGVVHAAFDPDLERHVALKVLRSIEPPLEPTQGAAVAARQRLLREARAMARLAHPNVITVHEVGSAGGRDYVAMELVDGQSLAEWLRAERRSEAEVIDAFVAAGRGLAAAHAAGIIHRDFKPHNVLRSRGGRIAVTDFGLARDAVAREPTAPPTLPGASSSAPTPLDGLTLTGSVLGTPAYMAPEQWRGETVSTASDQFAYCVALWEALAGKRPFRGETVDALRAAVERGAAVLDNSAIPARLRAPAAAGPRTDPAHRYPSMDALLAAIGRAERRPALAYVLGGALLVTALGAGILIAMSTRSAPGIAAVACAPPLLDPGSTWSETMKAALVERGQLEAARTLERDHRAWVTVRERTCQLAPGLREPRITCLDHVHARLDAVGRGMTAVPPGGKSVDPGAQLIDPALCESARPPRLTLATPQFREVLGEYYRTESDRNPPSKERTDALVAAAAADPCAAAWAYVLAAGPRTGGERTSLFDEAEQAAERCDDERVRAEIALTLAEVAIAAHRPTAAAQLRAAETAVSRVPQPDLQAELEARRMILATRVGNTAEAITRAEAALAGYRARGRFGAEVAAELALLDAYHRRAAPGDRESIPERMTALRERAIAELGASHDLVRAIDAGLAIRVWTSGDVERAHAQFVAQWRPAPALRPTPAAGRVVDAAGAPVAGARVAIGSSLAGTALAAAESLPHTEADLRFVTTGNDGTFAIPDGPPHGIAIAEHGALRSRPVSLGTAITLVLAATSRIEGKVILGSHRAEDVTISVVEPKAVGQPYQVLAPVRADGSFEIAGVVRAPVKVFAVVAAEPMHRVASVSVDARQPVARGVVIDLSRSDRTLHIVVRGMTSVPVPNAQVYVLPGKHGSQTLQQMTQNYAGATTRIARPVDESAPPPVRSLARSGDLYETVRFALDGVASACALGLPSDLDTLDLDHQIATNLEKIMLSCATIPPGAETILLEVPPWPRLD